jgi:hypothetical protein
MIPLEIHQSLKILSAHAKACAWFFKTPGLDPASTTDKKKIIKVHFVRF